ncbi:hypothetical protein [Spirosoma pomorum]
MKTLLDRFYKKTPHYPNAYRDLVDKLSRKRAFDTSLGTEEERFAQGKVFGNYYECFLYATLLGIRKDYRIPFERSEGTKFIEIEAWKPRQLTQYIFMSLLALSDINLIDLEELDEQRIDAKVFDLMQLMEEYAHGGFDLLQAKLRDEPHFFESQYATLRLLKF